MPLHLRKSKEKENTEIICHNMRFYIRNRKNNLNEDLPTYDSDMHNILLQEKEFQDVESPAKFIVPLQHFQNVKELLPAEMKLQLCESNENPRNPYYAVLTTKDHAKRASRMDPREEVLQNLDVNVIQEDTNHSASPDAKVWEAKFREVAERLRNFKVRPLASAHTEAVTPNVLEKKRVRSPDLSKNVLQKNLKQRMKQNKGKPKCRRKNSKKDLKAFLA